MKKWLFLLPLIMLGCDSSVTPPPPTPVPQVCSAYVIWEPPSMYIGGLPLSTDNFERFTIYVGDSPGRNQYDLIMVIDVLDTTSVAFRIVDLPYKASYIYMTVTDTEGAVSPLSPEWVWDCVTGSLYE